MDNIWAPWRLEYIKDARQKKEGAPCVFCDLGSKTPNRENLVLTKGKVTYVVMNRFPYNNGHLLICPYQHVAKLKALSPQVYQESLWFMGEGMEILGASMNAEGFNCGLNLGKTAGCGIEDHLHWHVIPRWLGDTNFMPVIGNTRVMPEYLGNTYDRIADGFQKLRSPL